MDVFPYGEIEKVHLTKKCAKLGRIIKKSEHIERPITPDPFVTLVHSIIAQQISTKATNTIVNRLTAKIESITPQNILAASEDDLQSCGIPPRKLGYIIELSKAARDRIDFTELAQMPDEEIIKLLTALPGIGTWTVQMLLIFSLRRPNVISFDDHGIRRGLMLLYKKERIGKKDFLHYQATYHPYASTASLYLWQLANQ